MWSAIRSTRTRVTECTHENRITTITAGLERAACEVCGDVRMTYVFDTWAKEAEQVEQFFPIVDED